MSMKAEPGDPIKPDPEMEDAPRMLDDDDYEDTGELELPSDPSQAWLLRVPRYLHDQWSTLDDDAEIRIGVLRRFKNGGKQKLLLDPLVKQHTKLPKEYDINTTGNNIKNTYIFSEKDLPGYRRGTRGNKNQTASNGVLGPNKEGGIEKSKQQQIHFRRAIPKQTSLRTVIRTEAHCNAVENPETERAIRQMAREEEESRMGVKFLEGDPRRYENLQFNRNKDKGGFDRMVKPVVRPRAADNKAIRMPQDELIDRIFQCFRRYTYWSMKSLKAELNQPEAYLKETLDGIAELVRSGTFNGHYKLRPEANVQGIDVSGEAAPEDSQVEDDDDLTGDEDLDMDDAA